MARPPFHLAPLNLIGLAPPSYGVHSDAELMERSPYLSPGDMVHDNPRAAQRARGAFPGIVSAGGTRTFEDGHTIVGGTTPAGATRVVTRHRSGSVTETHHTGLNGDDSGNHRAYHVDRRGGLSYSESGSAQTRGIQAQQLTALRGH